jgi:hypothetical protein
MKLAAQRAAQIWNEQSGSSLRLRVRNGGATTDEIPDAIVITAHPTACDTGVAGAYVKIGGTSAHRFVNGQVEMHRVSTLTNCLTPIQWGLDPNSPWNTDIVGMLVHEFGHAAFNLDHPNTPNCTYVGDSQSVMMLEDGTGPQRLRMLKQWDLELAQSRYGPRAPTTLL